MGNSQQVANPTNDINTAATLYGGVDAFMDVAGTAPGAMQAASPFMSGFGGGLAAFGLGWDIADIADNGLNADNGLSATGNALGVGSTVATLAGSTAAPVLAAGSAGLAVGGLMNNLADSDYNLLQDEQGRGTDDRWIDSYIESVNDRGGDPTSLGNIAMGGLVGTAGQLVDVGAGAAGMIGAGAGAVWSAVTGPW